jgi:hypothetical protein
VSRPGKGNGTRLPSQGPASAGPASGIPARGTGTRPPFEPGNVVALRHGIWSKRTIDPIAQEFVLGLTSERPELADYPEALIAWARAEARCVLIATYIGEHGMTDAEGKERGLLKYVGTFERLANELRGVLGLDPRSEAALARERAEAVKGEVDLVRLRARGRELRLAAEHREDS